MDKKIVFIVIEVFKVLKSHWSFIVYRKRYVFILRETNNQILMFQIFAWAKEEKYIMIDLEYICYNKYYFSYNWSMNVDELQMNSKINGIVIFLSRRA